MSIHYIDFRNAKTQETIHLEVYREYYVGEIFEKEMKLVLGEFYNQQNKKHNR